MVRGRRAVLEFTPNLTSIERYCAGVVLQLEDGTTHLRNAIIKDKAVHAFGEAGHALWSAAQVICESLALHWSSKAVASHPWESPFAGARIAVDSSFSARSIESAFAHALDSHSGHHVLLTAYELPNAKRPTNLVQRVRKVVRDNARTEHLARRFERDLQLGPEEAELHLKVDFLGQHFACYFLQPPSTDKLVDLTAERALGKLYSLQSVRRFLSEKRVTAGLFEDEQPNKFELLVVANPSNPVQSRAYRQIEALADSNGALVRRFGSVNEAAQHVVEMEG